MTFNFDEWRAARSKGGPLTVNFAGRDWLIPADMPWSLGDFLALRSLHCLSIAVRDLFGASSVFPDTDDAVGQFRAFTALGLSTEEVAQGVIDQVVVPAYNRGGEPPKSDGSTGSSEPASKKSKQTGDASTGST